MNAEQEVSTRGRRSPTERENQAIVMRPAVDIFEDEHSIWMYADLPGVAEEALELEVDDNTLTIQGDIAIDTPDDMRSLHADIRSTRYRRAFSLSTELDTTKISASLKDGLLSVVIPKREEVKPRRIEVTGG